MVYKAEDVGQVKRYAGERYFVKSIVAQAQHKRFALQTRRTMHF